MSPETKKNSRRKARVIVLSIIALIFVSSLSYVTFYLTYFIPADGQITSALDTYDYVEESNWYLFQGDQNNKNDAIFIYPNPRTDGKAYFYLASGLQSRGYNVFLGKSLFHQPILSTNLVAKAMEAYPAQTSWIIGSHLEGSNAVTKNVLKNTEKIRAAFYLGAVPNEEAFTVDTPLLILLGAIGEKTIEQKELQAIALKHDNVTLNIMEGATNNGFAFIKEKNVEPRPNQMTRNAQQEATVERLDKFIKVESGISIN